MPPFYAYLPMVWQQQQQSNWCWAAVTSMVCQFYSPDIFMSQCSVATAAVNQWRQTQNPPLASCNCCDPAVAPTGYCNVTWGLLPPLQLVGHFGGLQPGQISLDELLTQLSAGNPVCVQISWAGGGGHFIVINGAIKLTLPFLTLNLVWVEDPAYGPGDYAYDTVVSNYQGSGSWATTFPTVP
jgi:hypothetical protein